MSSKMGATCGQFTLVDSYLDIYHPFFSKSHIWITFIKFFPKIDCGCFPLNDNQVGRQNARSPVSLHMWTL